MRPHPQEFWYAGLRPYVHYLPLSEGLEDLHSRIEWAKRNQGALGAGQQWPALRSEN